MASLLQTTVLVPLIIGLVLGVIAPFTGRAQTLLAGAAMLVVYVLLEGLPALPPVSGKQKLAFLLMAAAFLALLPRPQGVVPAFLFGAAVWLGWPKLSSGSLGLQGLWLAAPMLACMIAPPRAAEDLDRLYLWPAVLMVFGLGAAVLSVLGVFMGFAQAIGAQVALLGGVLVVAYLRMVTSGSQTVLLPQTEALLRMGFGAVSLMIALFAPDISLPAYAVLSLTLLVPAVAPGLSSSPPALRPFAYALMAAVPAGLAIALALASAPTAT